jgi:hypothetical protein
VPERNQFAAAASPQRRESNDEPIRHPFSPNQVRENHCLEVQRLCCCLERLCPCWLVLSCLLSPYAILLGLNFYYSCCWASMLTDGKRRNVRVVPKIAAERGGARACEMPFDFPATKQTPGPSNSTDTTCDVGGKRNRETILQDRALEGGDDNETHTKNHDNQSKQKLMQSESKRHNGNKHTNR